MALNALNRTPTSQRTNIFSHKAVATPVIAKIGVKGKTDEKTVLTLLLLGTDFNFFVLCKELNLKTDVI